MRSIKKYVDAIEEELEGAKDYAEKAVEAKAKGDMDKAARYREMSNDELKHSSYLHGWAVEEITAISKVFKPPVEMQEKWEKAHSSYVESVALIKQMLSM
jgi:hypothetical protein